MGRSDGSRLRQRSMSSRTACKERHLGRGCTSINLCKCRSTCDNTVRGLKKASGHHKHTHTHTGVLASSDAAHLRAFVVCWQAKVAALRPLASYDFVQEHAEAAGLDIKGRARCQKQRVDRQQCSTCARLHVLSLVLDTASPAFSSAP